MENMRMQNHEFRRKNNLEVGQLGKRIFYPYLGMRRRFNIKFFKLKAHLNPFDSASDSDPDPDPVCVINSL